MKRFLKIAIIGSISTALFCSIVFFFQFFHSSGDISEIHFFRRKAIPFRVKTPVWMAYNSNKNEISNIYFQTVNAKTRGGFSEDWPKQNFTIKLAKKHSIAGLKKEDDWILGASFIDKSFLRHKLSFDLFRSFNKTNYAPHCAYTEVYRNFSYYGLFVVMERVDAKRLNLDKNDTTSCIFKEPPVFIHSSIEINNNQPEEDIYHQKFPKLEISNKNPIIQQLREFISESSDSIFEKDIEKWFDLANIIDWHILLMLTHNDDGIIKNFYLYKKDTNTPFRIAPWDCDNTFGRDCDNEYHEPEIIDYQRNILLKRLINSKQLAYKKRLKARYEQLVQFNIITSENILSLVSIHQQKIRPFVLKNENRWPVDYHVYYDNANFNDEIQLIKKWVPQQLKILEDHILQNY